MPDHADTGGTKPVGSVQASEWQSGSSGPPPQDTPAGHAVLRVLRITLHTGFAALLVVGAAGTLAAAPRAAVSYLTLTISVLLGALYFAGTVTEKRAAEGGNAPWGVEPNRYHRVWLAAITMLWLLLLALSADFSWLAFALFFLHLHLLSTRHAIAAVSVLTGAVVAAQWNRDGELHAAMILGPTFGAVFAVIMAIVYQSLYTEGVNQRLALDELRRTRTILAHTQHEAGVIVERERLAREIHDTLAQGLSSIVLISRAAETSLDAGATELTRERIRTIQAEASENLAEARRFVRAPGPKDANAESLVLRLRRTCENTERQAAARGTSLRCRFELDGEAVRLSTSCEVALLRAAQSSLSNVAQHARASTAVLTLGFLGPDVTMDIYDDGVGFDAAATLSAAMVRPDGSGFGLRSVRERIMGLGGLVGVESANGEGTVVAIRLPLVPFEEDDHA